MPGERNRTRICGGKPFGAGALLRAASNQHNDILKSPQNSADQFGIAARRPAPMRQQFACIRVDQDKAIFVRVKRRERPDASEYPRALFRARRLTRTKIALS